MPHLESSYAYLLINAVVRSSEAHRDPASTSNIVCVRSKEANWERCRQEQLTKAVLSVVESLWAFSSQHVHRTLPDSS
jgi:hypothetical protein